MRGFVRDRAVSHALGHYDQLARLEMDGLSPLHLHREGALKAEKELVLPVSVPWELAV